MQAVFNLQADQHWCTQRVNAQQEGDRPKPCWELLELWPSQVVIFCLAVLSVLTVDYTALYLLPLSAGSSIQQCLSSM